MKFAKKRYSQVKKNKLTKWNEDHASIPNNLRLYIFLEFLHEYLKFGKRCQA